MSRIEAKLAFVCTLAILCTNLSGCMDGIRKIDGYECADFVAAELYYGRQRAERLAEIRTYPIEKQYAVFICGVHYMKPPLWASADPFMERGASAIGFLKSKLAAPRHDWEVFAIVGLIGNMSTFGSYAALEDKELMRAVEISISKMRDPHIKERAKVELQLVRDIMDNAQEPEVQLKKLK